MDERVVVENNGRLAEAARYLADEALDGLVAASNGLNNFLESNAVYVFSGVRPIGESAVVLDRDGRSTLIVTPAWDEARAAAASSTDRTIGTDDLAATLKSAVGTHRLDLSRTVSVGLSLLGAALVDRMTSALGALPKAADELARDFARLRTPEELAAAERATWIAERGYERLLEFARPGIREFELAAELYCFVKKLGAEDNFLLLSASQHNLAVRAAGERVLDVGDIILSELTPCYRGQFAQICRTTVIGEPRPVIGEKFAILQDAMGEGLHAGRAGATVADLDSHELLAASFGAHPEFSLDSRMQPNRPRGSDRFDRILDQIQEHAFQSACIAHDVGQARVEVLQHREPSWRIRKEPGHTHRRVQDLVDIDRLLRHPARRADRQHLLDQRGYPLDSGQDHAAVLLRAVVVGIHPGHQLGGTLDTGQWILDLMREAGWR